VKAKNPFFTPLQQRREVPWEKVPFVARPSLIADPITAFGKKKPLVTESSMPRYEGSIVQKLKTEIKPKAESQLRPLEPYKSPRDITRERVMNELRHHQNIRDAGGIQPYLTDKQSLDCILPKLHGSSRLAPREFRGPIY
jgi:hypothetical protein